jgi:putative hydrolase of the HAD superfamily
MDATGPEVFFTDDSPAKLTGAAALGMTTHHFMGIDPLREALRNAGIRIGA